MTGLRTPQARVLAALMPKDPTFPQFDWPVLTRVGIADKVGVSSLSDLVWRALKGLKGGNPRRPGHPGLIDLGLVEATSIDIDGLKETNYRITQAGIAAMQEYIAAKGEVPPVKDRKQCVNMRYVKEEMVDGES